MQYWHSFDHWKGYIKKYSEKSQLLFEQMRRT